MANKPQAKSWSEIQMAIAAIAVTVTLGFWNQFSIPDKAQAAAQVAQNSPPPPPPPATETAQPTATAFVFRPVKIIFGGKAPQPQVIQVAVAAPAIKKKSGGGGGSPAVDAGGGGAAPAPAASTGSSKP